jgi:hypothetical protein
VTNLTFYCQARVDGGRRWGIDSAVGELLQHFEPGSTDPNPSLLWFIDVLCEGESLPDDPQGARDWFLKNQDFFVKHLTKIADEQLDLGFDAEYRPYEREIADGPDLARVKIAASAIRRVVAREMAAHVREVARRWGDLIGVLSPASVT